MTQEDKKKIKVFAFRFNAEDRIEALKKLQQHGVEIAYWDAGKGTFEKLTNDRKNFPHTIFHNTADAVEGICPLEIDVASFPPVGLDLANTLLKCESQALVMFNAVDLTNVPLPKKKHTYYHYVRYWHGVLKSLKPDAILFGDIPHSTYQYVAYCLAKFLGIKTIMFRNIQIPGRLLFFDDFEEYSRIRDEYKKAESKNITIRDLSSDVREFYETQTSASSEPTLFYMKKKFVKDFSTSYPLPRIHSVIKNLTRGTFIKTAYGYVLMFFIKRRVGSIERFEHRGFFVKLKEQQWSMTKKRFKREYESLLSPVDFSKKFVYVPLTNQPECSTNPIGDIFVDQALMVEILAHSLPKDWVLYVKESALQFAGPRTQTGRYKDYYRDIARLSSVRFVSTDTSTFDLIHKAQAIATVTSTAGLEALLRGKPVLLFGNTWYAYCNGVFRVADTRSVIAAFDTILRGYKPDKQKVLNFLGVIDRLSVRGFLNTRFKREQGLEFTNEVNAETLAQGFLKELHADR